MTALPPPLRAFSPLGCAILPAALLLGGCAPDWSLQGTAAVTLRFWAAPEIPIDQILPADMLWQTFLSDQPDHYMLTVGDAEQDTHIVLDLHGAALPEDGLRIQDYPDAFVVLSHPTDTGSWTNQLDVEAPTPSGTITMWEGGHLTLKGLPVRFAPLSSAPPCQEACEDRVDLEVVWSLEPDTTTKTYPSLGPLFSWGMGCTPR